MDLQTAADHTVVVVVGGSLVGLSSALFLAHHNVQTILIEKHQTSSLHPRALGYTARTMEHFRTVGLGDAIPQVPSSFRLRRVTADCLAGEWSESTQWNPKASNGGGGGPKVMYSPMTGASCAQDKLEPLIRDQAVKLGADVRVGVRMLDFSQDDTGVHVNVRAIDGKEYTTHADYMVAADGHRSQVREALGIKMSGRGYIKTLRSILFRANLDHFLAKGVHQWTIVNSDMNAFLTSYGDGRWVLMPQNDIELNVDQQREAVLRAIGIPNLKFEIITTGRWDLSARIADQYSFGRVFLIGDAAHTLPPTRGGYGANTGIHDAASLAWKLAAVTSGVSKPELLETYNAERQPIGWNRHQQVFARPDYAAMADPAVQKEVIIDDDAMELGELYRSNSVLADNLEDLPLAKRPDEWAGQPGTRAPHLWMTKAKSAARVSTIDLFGKYWTVITKDSSWRRAGENAGKTLALEVKGIVVGEDVYEGEEGAFAKGFGLNSGGASLIRPDGVVAWRSKDRLEDADTALAHALRSVLHATR